MRRRRTSSIELDMSVVAPPPHMGLLRHRLVVVHLRLLAGELHQIRIDLLSADPTLSHSRSPDLHGCA
jgi:hypothetical protein